MTRLQKWLGIALLVIGLAGLLFVAGGVSGYFYCQSDQGRSQKKQLKDDAEAVADIRQDREQRKTVVKDQTEKVRHAQAPKKPDCNGTTIDDPWPGNILRDMEDARTAIAGP